MPMYRDRYEPIALAGRGAQGEVWMAHDHIHDRPVALKIRNLAGAPRDAVLSEARTLLGMRPHDSLPLVRDDFFIDDRYVMVMDWIEGRSLATARTLPFDETISYLEGVAGALDHLHAHDPAIIHRDVKPQNVIVTADGRVVLVDLGVSAAALTYLDGTPGFVAPEVAAGAPATPASDVFSLAVTAFVLLTGTFPAPGGADLASVPETQRGAVGRALEDALSIDPRVRPSSASEFVRSLRPADTPNNIPAALSSFIGRRAEAAGVRRALSSSRLVTLVGTGGAGKTRLAMHVASQALPSYPNGVWIAELAGVADPELVASRVAVALGVRTDGGRSPIDGLRDRLQGTTLLVLDNCEHVIDASAHLVEALLRSIPALTILATSREPLRAGGEAVVDIAPLDEHDAAALFRARLPPGRDVAEDDQRVDEACRRLDGVPLALELAAAQLRTLDIDELITALERSLSVLTGGARTNPRHETMLATIEWSYRLLAPDGQRALARLSVFAGGTTREAAHRVADADEELDHLVAASLVVRDGGRYRMLEPIRQFAEAVLRDAGDLDTYRSRHAHWVLELARRTETIDPDWIARLSEEHDNVEAALSFSMHDDPMTAGEIVRRAVLYWTHTGYWAQGREWVRRALAADELPVPLRAELLNRAGDMARNQGDLTEARDLLERSVSMNRQLADDHALGLALLGLGLTAHAQGELERSKAIQLEAIAVNTRVNNERGLAMALNNLAIVHDSLGELREAILVLERALDLHVANDARLPAALTTLNLAAMHRKAGDRSTARRLFEESLGVTTSANHILGRKAALMDLASMDLSDGDVDAARRRAEESLELARRSNDPSSEAQSLHLLGGVAHALDDLEAATELHAQATALRREIGAPLDLAVSLDLVGIVAVERGHAAEAVRSFAEAAALRDEAKAPPSENTDVEPALASARDALGPQVFEREWEAGRANASPRRP